ncbi:hypothetical protein SAY86_027381 [Trapa natans]|uniref:Uncharacterized protein n=1 Tax=Trapa natans TaxID=22666 RepID=A0AAN7QJ80_TRANT|nr:hypothetical protein SAY86_027381 [Trapa natans]
MSARRVDRRQPISGDAVSLLCGDYLWCAEGRMVEEFVMEQPIPPYLFAFAVGELGFWDVGGLRGGGRGGAGYDKPRGEAFWALRMGEIRSIGATSELPLWRDGKP